MTTKLTLYNDALLILGERFLASVSEEREPRRLLDQVWASGGIDRCLEEGQWHFAMRTIQIDPDPSIEPDYGYRLAYQKPDDWISTCGLCSDEWFNEPLLQYTDEAGFWYADIQPLYVRYISNDVDYGNNMNKWPKSFVDFVACHFASKIAGAIQGGKINPDDILKLREKLLKVAKNKAAMAEPTKFASRGSWIRARTRSPGRRDGGNSGSLIG